MSFAILKRWPEQYLHQYAPTAARKQFRKLLNAISFSYIENVKSHYPKTTKTNKADLLHSVTHLILP
tara:strand:- start:424 stop:624 length:201 start_codon:yes stop_codon:yes gene_type:complete